MIDVIMPKIKRMRLKSPERVIRLKRPRSIEVFQQNKICKTSYQSVKSQIDVLRAIVNIQRIYRGWKYKHVFHLIKYPFYTL